MYSVFEGKEAVPLPIWQELMVGVELIYLRASPVFYGFGIPHGDDSAVIVIPGFLGTDLYLAELYAWLKRIGYKPYFSGIGLNAECPNILIRKRLNETIDKAYRETHGKLHLIGHSLGGVIARSSATQRPDRIASVITLGSPFRGTVCHPAVLRASEAVRDRVLREHAHSVLPSCYTSACTCDFIDSLRACCPDSVDQTAIYTKSDGIVDWHYCITGDPEIDKEVSGTHVGLVFNPIAYGLIATRLAKTAERVRAEEVVHKGHHRRHRSEKPRASR